MINLLNCNDKMEDLVVKQDSNSGLIAIIAIHNTQHGPALGGCRFVNYSSVDDAISDAMKLAKAMTYKSAMANLPLGGGKSVIISHSKIYDRRKIFEEFGDFVNALQGKYITASDSGTNEEDMKIVSTKTKYVTSINKTEKLFDNTAYMTALGVVRAIEAAVKCKLNKDSLDGVRVAIQGVGSVGFILAKLLIQKGATVTISDKNSILLREKAKELKSQALDPELIYEVSCDVFAPCALGGVINKTSIQKLKASIVCGAANNQLQELDDADILKEKGILYIPDYLTNSGGVICAASQAGIITQEESYSKIMNIYDSVIKIVNLSEQFNLSTIEVANRLVEEGFSS